MNLGEALIAGETVRLSLHSTQNGTVYGSHPLPSVSHKEKTNFDVQSHFFVFFPKSIKVRPGARPAMATINGNEQVQLGQVRSMVEAQGSVLNDLAMAAREALNTD